MTKIEVEHMSFQTVLTIWTGTDRGATTSTLIFLTPKQRQQLIKALQPPKQQSNHEQ